MGTSQLSKGLSMVTQWPIRGFQELEKRSDLPVPASRLEVGSEVGDRFDGASEEVLFGLGIPSKSTELGGPCGHLSLKTLLEVSERRFGGGLVVQSWSRMAAVTPPLQALLKKTSVGRRAVGRSFTPGSPLLVPTEFLHHRAQRGDVRRCLRLGGALGAPAELDRAAMAAEGLLVRPGDEEEGRGHGAMGMAVAT